MRTRASIALLLPLACLLGCTLPYTPSPLTGNWQIQSGTAITSPPTYPYLVGALQGTNSALTGTFTAQIYTVNSTVESYSGTFNPSTGSLVLNSTLPLPANQTTAALSVPANPTDLATGTLVDQCGVCANGISTQVVGVEVAPLNGTYTGTLSGTLNTYSPFTSTPITGTTSVTFTQSATPNASGQFPLTGTITFPSSSGLGTASLGGTVSGIGLTLGFYSTAVVGPNISLTAYTNPTASQITITNLGFSSGLASENAAYTGTLTLQ